MSTDPGRAPGGASPAAGGRGGLADGMRLAVGTLSVLRVPPPRVVDRTTGAWAMVLAPLVAVLLAMPALLLMWLLAPPAYGPAREGLGPLAVSALVLATLTAATRAMHLDGLADTADGLGSGRPSVDALEVMRRGDVGPFGVVTLLLVLLVETAALAEVLAAGAGPLALTTALVVSRLALPLLCSRGVPAARPDGLGRAVAGSVSRPMALLAVLLAVAAAGVATLVLAPLAGDGGQVLGLVAVAPVGLLAGAALAWRCVRRLGGVTGDVMGAVVEVTFAATLVVLALVA